MSPQIHTSKKILNFNQDPRLQSLVQRANTLALLNQALRARLDKPIADRLTLANIRQNTAVILVESSAWLTRLRYLAPIIVEEIQKLGLKDVTSIDMKVAPQDHTPALPVPAAHRPSPDTLKRLKQMTESLPDERVRDAIQRIIDDSDF
ncbi:MAG: DUF721 domain-containing protein [Pseudomonadota bacterium]